LKINGIVGKYSGPTVQAAITIAEVGVRNQLISLLFDTGATYTQLSERDWRNRCHIDPSLFVKKENEPTLTGREEPWRHGYFRSEPGYCSEQRPAIYMRKTFHKSE